MLIPLVEIQRVIDDEEAYNRDTIDIFIEFSEDGVRLKYHDNAIDVIKFQLINPLQNEEKSTEQTENETQTDEDSDEELE
ncbi:MAG: hypothetical protein MUO64_05800 [Anaerolineales bacterium]|nr:hypothetical protein [Anaerolineales bacterium]